jgi:hypothetical protein
MSAVSQPVRIAVEEYLATSYRPDCDYVDGAIEERNVGEFDHSFLRGCFSGSSMKIEKPGKPAFLPNSGFGWVRARFAFRISASCAAILPKNR